MRQVAIGIDVGGTGIKGAAVDLSNGERITGRFRVPTPSGGRPADIADEVAAMSAAIRAELSESLSAVSPPIGIALPGVLRDGIMHTAANLDAAWIGLDAAALLADATGSRCAVLNDADAAGLAETAFGAAKDLSGLTMVLTFGTGIGTAAVYNGTLIPNFELGHLELDGHPDIERYVSPKNIDREGLSLQEWADRAARYVRHLELVMHPEHFIIGGSISKVADEYLPFAGVRARCIRAHFMNDAGIVGAAAQAHRLAA